MKKNLSKAMAAAMAVAAVAPAVAQPVVADAAGVTRADSLVQATPDGGTTTQFTANARNAKGYQITTRGTIGAPTDSSLGDNVFSRVEAFDGNLTEQISDDTLKTVFGTDAIIVATKTGSQINLKGHQYVIGKKLSVAKANSAKAQLDAVNADIQRLKNAGYTIVETVKTAEGFGKDNNTPAKVIYNEGTKVVTASKNGVVEFQFTINGVEDAKLQDTVGSLRTEFDGLKDDFRGTSASTTDDYYRPASETTKVTLNVDATSTPSNVKDRYYNLNSLIIFLNTNAAKFDIVKYEDTTRNIMTVKVYQKGLKTDAGLVQEVTLVGLKNLDKNLVLGQIDKNDFKGHWAESEIKEAMVNGWVDNSNTFRPQDSVTRAEFAKMVCTIFGIKTDEDSIDGLLEPFNDVKSSDWHYKYIVALYNYQAGKQKATSNGSLVSGLIGKGLVIGGYEDDTFRANAKITREEAAKMMAAAYELSGLNKTTDGDRKVRILQRAYDSTGIDKGTSFKEANINTDLDGVVDNVLTGKDGAKIQRDVKTVFTDDKNIATWADEAVYALNNKDVLSGNPDGTFTPKAQITRAEALVMVMRAGK